MTGLKRFTPLAAALVAAIAAYAPPAAAQSGDKVLIVYGDEPCPTSASGEEIVVCARKPERERYRIPEELRTTDQSKPANSSWASRASSFEYVGRSGTNSCTPSGNGGWTGCYGELMRKAKEEKRQNKIQERSEEALIRSKISD